MNYLEFHLFFTLPILLLLSYRAYRLPEGKRRHLKSGILLMTLVAVTYTLPWDSYLIEQGVWFYGEDAVHSWVAGVPLGEFLFFNIQTVGTGLLLYNIGFDSSETDAKIFGDLGLAVPFILLSLIGLWLVVIGGRFFYLGAILGWAIPVIALQWLYGGQKLLEERSLISKAVVFPSLYLWVIDRTALGLQIWKIAKETRTGLEIFGLPVEEALFFVVTNIMVVQGLVLYEWTLEQVSLIENPLLERLVK